MLAVFGRKWQGTGPGAAGVVPQIVMLKAKQDTWLKSARASGSHLRLTAPKKDIRKRLCTDGFVIYKKLNKDPSLLVYLNHWLCEEAGPCQVRYCLKLLYRKV